MANVLEKICANKAEELVKLKQQLPLDSFIKTLTPSDRSMFAALSQPNAGFILECKKASPSKGLIRENFDLDEIIAAYSPYAAAISVLTDKKYFSGSFDYLRYVRERVSQPVLNKDFFIDPYQVHLARYHNADAILLMLSVLDDTTYTEMANLAERYRLDVLTEVSNEQEAHRACRLGAKIIGINNRDLRDLSTNLNTTFRLAPLLPKDAILISESGIYTHSDVRKLAPVVNGFLVGSSLMAEQNVAKAVQKLLYGKVKICGITNKEDGIKVQQSPASYAGLIFAEKSPRCISLSQAKQITDNAPQDYVGVFVNQPVEFLLEAVTRLNLSAVQLHGGEDQDYIDQLRQQLPIDVEIWQAKGVTTRLPELDNTNVDYFLLDCQIGQQTGGTGQSFNWQLLSQLADKSSLILAGGLSPQNIRSAAIIGAAILDVNSGVESQPGQKDVTRISELFSELRTY
ncbi:bifunctional indole-3-glycerol-phosphate synthase TrpC/phosphoribosylanthranilate isomerase TrpF [Neptunicella sp. SCSIO 80796]|uniref:bifunctional indole-3-glycerol-phosphate synthase TrpC/phosphoribosylanthranilate isomerase TrpF n=1 Tax=Neptunicella plasticusilytica TaxID=3117012 RepID=UPI003A4D7301